MYTYVCTYVCMRVCICMCTHTHAHSSEAIVTALWTWSTLRSVKQIRVRMYLYVYTHTCTLTRSDYDGPVDMEHTLKRIADSRVGNPHRLASMFRRYDQARINRVSVQEFAQVRLRVSCHLCVYMNECT